MKHPVKNILKEAGNMHLTEHEKASTLIMLKSFIADHPAHEAVRDLLPSRHIGQPYGVYSLLALPAQRPMFVTLIIALVLASGGGVSYAAEMSLPGDSLYGIKVHVNENVKSALTFSAHSQALWDAQRAERRLKEVELLAVEDALTAEREADLEQRFKMRARQSYIEAEQLTQNKNMPSSAMLHARFEARLRAHEHILTRIQEQQNDLQLGQRIKSAVQTEIEAHTTARAQKEIQTEAQTQIDMEAETKKKEAEVKNKLEHAEESLRQLITKESADTQLKINLNLRVDAAKESAVKANEQAEAQQHSKALKKLQDTEIIIEEIDTTIKLMNDLGFTSKKDQKEKSSSKTGPQKESASTTDDVQSNNTIQSDMHMGAHTQITIQADTNVNISGSAASADPDFSIQQHGDFSAKSEITAGHNDELDEPHPSNSNDSPNSNTAIEIETQSTATMPIIKINQQQQTETHIQTQ